MMNSIKRLQVIPAVMLFISFAGCVPKDTMNKPRFSGLPDSFGQAADTSNDALRNWKEFFSDTALTALIDTAIQNNPEVNISLQEMIIASNEVKMRQSMLFPFVNAKGGAGVDKSARYTSEGAGNASTEMSPGKKIPEPLSDLSIGFQASWEADIWHKIRNSKQSAVQRYLATVEGKNFVLTNLVSEIARSYYELLSLDNQLHIIRESIELQKRELEIVRQQKEAARATALAVKQFEAQVYAVQGMENDVLQQITENENKINFLLGRFPQHIVRDSSTYQKQDMMSVHSGIPLQLLVNRPDIRQAEHELSAAGLDVKVARSEFLPSLGFEAELGYRAYKPSLFLSTPESVLFSLVGGLSAPVFNRNILKAEYRNANARQTQALYAYRNTLLNSYAEVSNQMSGIKNLEQTFQFKSRQVETLNQSIDIAHDLFLSARADYLEVLTAQREALNSKLELNETLKSRYIARIDMYRALGGGWR